MSVVLLSSTLAFTPSFNARSLTSRQHAQLALVPPSLLTAVEVFDGSDIVDPIVVSSVFWTSLKAKLLSFFIGQVLAVAVFAIVSTFAAHQVARLGDYVSKNIFHEKKGFQKLPTRAAKIIQPDLGKLLLCIAIDVIGTSSELVPVLGEATDIVWAPIAALLLRSLYGSNIVFGLELVEELLPFTDILPLATVCWVVDTFFEGSDFAKLLQIGQYGRVVEEGSSVIDVGGGDEEPKRMSGDNKPL